LVEKSASLNGHRFVWRIYLLPRYSRRRYLSFPNSHRNVCYCNRTISDFSINSNNRRSLWIRWPWQVGDPEPPV